MNAPEKKNPSKRGTPKTVRPVPSGKKLPSLSRTLDLPTLDTVKRAAVVCCALTMCLALLVNPVDAAKKKKADAELEKALTPITKILDELVVKAEANALFSAKENGEMLDVKFKLIDLMKDNGKNAGMAKPMFQTGLIMVKREQFSDAYELFNYIATNFVDSPYSGQARMEMNKMKKLLGEEQYNVLVSEAAPVGGEKPEKGK